MAIYNQYPSEISGDLFITYHILFLGGWGIICVYVGEPTLTIPYSRNLIRVWNTHHRHQPDLFVSCISSFWVTVVASQAQDWRIIRLKYEADLAVACINPTGFCFTLFILLMKDLILFDFLSRAYVLLTSFPKIPVNDSCDWTGLQHNCGMNQISESEEDFSLPQILE